MNTLTEALDEELSPRVQAKFTIKSIDGDEQIAYGEVYAPYVIDSHGEMMLPEDVRKMAHRFLILQRNHFIDIMHNNKVIKASIVESYIAKAGEADFNEGAWVLAVHVGDTDAWADIKVGKLNGYSFEAMVYKYDAEVVYEYQPIHFGLTEESGGHFHAFYVEVDKDGRVTGGWSGPGGTDDHVHAIKYGTATELADGHGHRFFLNEIEE